MFFSILARRLLRHGQFTSPHDLAVQMLTFVEHYNLTANHSPGHTPASCSPHDQLHFQNRPLDMSQRGLYLGGVHPGHAAAVKRDRTLAEVLDTLGRARPAVTIHACSLSEHLLQIYAGFYALHAAGHIRLTQRFSVEALRQRLAGAQIDEGVLSNETNGLLAEVEGGGLVYFDLRDGANFYPGVASHVELYAKRSFRRSLHASHPGRIVPLGLNYAVYPYRTTLFELARSLAQLDLSGLAAKHLLVSVARLVPALGGLLDVPTVMSVSGAPERNPPRRALFLARTWNPAEIPGPGIAELNDLRAACIRVLRRRLGARFFGGFSRSAHACTHYPDCVVDASVSTRRRDYLNRLRGYPVCVATAGLFESIGWKFAEYVALAKAIVSEPIRFEVPGGLAASENFVEFSTAEDCADRVTELLEDDAARLRMMESNFRHHAEYGTVQAVVGRALYAALSPTG